MKFNNFRKALISSGVLVFVSTSLCMAQSPGTEMKSEKTQAVEVHIKTKGEIAVERELKKKEHKKKENPSQPMESYSTIQEPKDNEQMKPAPEEDMIAVPAANISNTWEEIKMSEWTPSEEPETKPKKK